jgi:hypothetical protein
MMNDEWRLMMLGVTDAILLEAMFQSWRSVVVGHEAEADGFDRWLRRIFVTKLQLQTEGALA